MVLEEASLTEMIGTKWLQQSDILCKLVIKDAYDSFGLKTVVEMLFGPGYRAAPLGLPIVW